MQDLFVGQIDVFTWKTKILKLLVMKLTPKSCFWSLWWSLLLPILALRQTGNLDEPGGVGKTWWQRGQKHIELADSLSPKSLKSSWYFSILYYGYNTHSFSQNWVSCEKIQIYQMVFFHFPFAYIFIIHATPCMF